MIKYLKEPNGLHYRSYIPRTVRFLGLAANYILKTGLISDGFKPDINNNNYNVIMPSLATH